MNQGNTHILTHFDWKRFFYMILELYNIEDNMESWRTLKKRLRNHILDKGLLVVMQKFGDVAFSTDVSKDFPDYDRLERFINKEIANKHVGSPIFSWL